MQDFGIQNSIMLDPIQGMLSENSHNIVHKGCTQINPQKLNASSFSTSSIDFSYTTPGNNSLISRFWHVQVTATFNFSGTTVSGNLLDTFEAAITANGQPTLMGLRAYPLTSCANNITLTLNNNTVSTQPNKYVNALGHILSDEQLRENFTGVQYPDQNQLYSQSVGAALYEFSGYGTNWYGSRIQGPVYNVLTNTPTAGSIQVTWYEEVMIPPLLWNRQGGAPGLAYVNTFNLNYGLNNISRMWSSVVCNPTSIVAGEPRTLSITSVSIDAAVLHFNYLTPSSIKPLPQRVQYNAPQLFPINYDYTSAIAPGDSTIKSIQSNSIQLVTIPSKIVIFVAKKLGSATNDLFATDSLCVIDKLSVTLNNQPLQLGNMNTFDLWKLSKRNGLNMSWEQFNNKQGSLIVLNLATSDLVVNDDLAVSSQGSYQFQADVQFHSLVPAEESIGSGIAAPSYQWSLNTLFVYEQFCIIDNSSNTSFVSGINPSEYLKLVLNKDIDAHYSEYIPSVDYIGGSFWSSFKEGLSKALNVAKGVGRKVQEYLPAVQEGFNKYAVPLGMAIAPEFTAPIALAANEAAETLKHILPQLVGQGLSLPKIQRMFPHIPQHLLAEKYNKQVMKNAGALLGGKKKVAKKSKKGGAIVGGKKVLKSRMY